MPDIYDLSGPFGTRFKTNGVRFEPLSEVIPSLEYIKFTMIQPSAGDVIDMAHQRAGNAEMVFVNSGKREVLEVSGAYLWRFLTAVPHNLADESGTNYRNETYGGVEPERLVDILRRIYRHLLIPNETIKESAEAERVSSILVDREGYVHAQMGPTISEEDAREIEELLNGYLAENQDKVISEIQFWMDHILSSPPLKQSFERDGDCLKPVFTEIQWPEKLSELSWRDFMGSLTSQTTNDCPAYLSVSDCWDKQCDEMVKNALKALSESHSGSRALKRLADVALEHGVDLTKVNGTQALFEQFSKQAEALGETVLRDHSLTN
ncbi:hypothetical protein [Marinobacter salsuginis]|jgi:hypothetical protein|uniref:Uncharacterized protein n=1 Tax=Marinobacter salsuginis TaxID=418719 RepID=A0A5M3Q265_9GAMM|nr:hypothetical protein [Marinobacter salsuginis]GBO89217.1 hypothetical protein MSSD14B_28850 [Marinobacter salsuginis]